MISENLSNNKIKFPPLSLLGCRLSKDSNTWSSARSRKQSLICVRWSNYCITSRRERYLRMQQFSPRLSTTCSIRENCAIRAVNERRFNVKEYYADQKTAIVSIHKKVISLCLLDSSNREMKCGRILKNMWLCIFLHLQMGAFEERVALFFIFFKSSVFNRSLLG